MSIFGNLSIQNIIVTANLQQTIDISSFNKYEHLSSDLRLYNCGYVKNKFMIGRVSVFANGKMISAGTKSSEQAQKELKMASRILQVNNLSNPIKIISQVRNIVARFNLEKSLPIEQLARILPKSMYEPEQFPGLIYRMQGSCVALLFASGKGILVGCKSLNELHTSFFELKQSLSFHSKEKSLVVKMPKDS
jgi:transcription initiation factor TFIID TATA-box-binding protein